MCSAEHKTHVFSKLHLIPCHLFVGTAQFSRQLIKSNHSNDQNGLKVICEAKDKKRRTMLAMKTLPTSIKEKGSSRALALMTCQQSKNKRSGGQVGD